MSRLLALSVALAAGCSSSSGGSGSGPSDGGSSDGPGVVQHEAAAPDAPGDDGGADEGGGVTPRKCAVPTGVPDPLVISGKITARTVGSSTPAASATVDLLDNATDSVLATTTTAADGTYTLPGVPSGGNAVLAHARITLASYVTTYFYVVDGLFTQTLSTTIYSPSLQDGAAGAGGVTWDHSNGIVEVFALPCHDGKGTDGLAGAQVAVLPGGSTTVYTDANGNPSPGLTATMAPFGAALDFNVHPGKVGVHLTYQGATTSYVVQSAAGAFTVLLDFP